MTSEGAEYIQFNIHDLEKWIPFNDNFKFTVDYYVRCKWNVKF